ncbi:MAG: PDZ domain-containing protein [Blastocatellia bacterium]
MSKSTTISSTGLVAALILVSAASGKAQQKPQDLPAVAPPWAVTVVHTFDVYTLIKRIEQTNHVRVGIIAAPSQNPVNITTGLVIDGEGHVLTRLNEVDPDNTSDESIEIIFGDGSKGKAKLIGVDGPTGFALLKTDVPNLHPPAFNQNGLAPGLAIEILSSDVNPAYGPVTGEVRVMATMKVSAGLVGASSVFAALRGAYIIDSPELSARKDGAIVTTSDFKVLGMAQSAGLQQGKGYLYPISLLRDNVAARILARNGSVPPCWLGVFGMNVAQLGQDQMELLGSKSGVVVTSVDPSSNAAQYGIKRDDVIVGIDDQQIAGVAEMGAALSAFPAGEQVLIHAVRSRQAISFNLVLGARPLQTLQTSNVANQTVSTANNSGIPRANGQIVGIEQSVAAGFVARQLTPQLAEFFNSNGGSIVTSVTKGSRAAGAGLVAGDVVVGTSGQPALTASELESVFETQASAIVLKVVRNRKEIELTILPEHKPEAR